MSIDPHVTVLYVNPVGFSSYDQVFADMIVTYKNPSTHAIVASLNPATTPPKMTDLEFRAYETLVAGDTLKAARYFARAKYDAMVIGCFYDPGLIDCREISQTGIVVAPCQSACAAAMTVANNFSVIIGEWKWEDQMRQTICDYGYGDKLASFEAVGLRVEEFHVDPEKTKKFLTAAAIRAVVEGKAECIILGCTLEVGFYAELQTLLQERFDGQYIPVIDCSIAAFKAAEAAAYMSKCGLTTSRIWGMAPPSEEELAKFGILQDKYEFGNMIDIPATVA